MHAPAAALRIVGTNIFGLQLVSRRECRSAVAGCNTMNDIGTRPVIRASTRDIAAVADFLSLLFDAPVVITAASDEVPTPGVQHLVMIVAATPAA